MRGRRVKVDGDGGVGVGEKRVGSRCGLLDSIGGKGVVVGRQVGGVGPRTIHDLGGADTGGRHVTQAPRGLGGSEVSHPAWDLHHGQPGRLVVLVGICV